MADLSMARRALPTSLCVALLGVALAGCGGSSPPSENFVAKADAVCRQTQQQFDRIQVTPPATATQAEKQASALADVSEQALTDLRKLTPPESLRSAYDRYLAARQQALSYLEDGRDAAAAHDAAAYARAKRLAAARQAKRLEFAKRVGLKVCSRPSLTLGGPG